MSILIYDESRTSYNYFGYQNIERMFVMPKRLWYLIIGMVVNVTGASFLWPLNTIYLHDYLGKSLSVAGMVLMLNSAASVIGNLVGGHLFDRLGGYRAILIGIMITLSALIGLTHWHGWPHYLFFLLFIGLGSGIVFPAMYAMAGTTWKEGGRKAFNAMYVAQNIGVALGSGLGGFIASISIDYIFMANLSLYVVFLLVAVFCYREIGKAVQPSTNVVNEAKPIRNLSHMYALLILCAGYLLCWVGYVQWQTTIATYTQQLHISLQEYSLLWTINGVLIVTLQPLLSYVLKKLSPSLKMQIIVGIFIFIGSFVIAAYAKEFTMFALAMVIITLGEILIWPAVPTVANGLAPEGREGFYQGIVNSAATGGRMLGPLYGGLMVDLFGMAVLFITLIALCIFSIVFTLVYDRPLKQSLPSPRKKSVITS
jgi:MFS family permease